MSNVVTCEEHWHSLSDLLSRYGLALVRIADGANIPGTHWGVPEAGLVGLGVHARRDTPVHSVLHEACHVICMDGVRREVLDTDASGDTDEENAVCYLSILLADAVPDFGQARMLADMDTWGYTFRLGSARAWFERDADDARAWLIEAGLLTVSGLPVTMLRT